MKVQARARRRGGPAAGEVISLDQARIERALRQRERYRYVRPQVLREGAGWKVRSPNCSRNIDPQGGEIDIAWLLPTNNGLWLLHARDHRGDCWSLQTAGLPLAEALAALCADPGRIYWP